MRSSSSPSTTGSLFEQEARSDGSDQTHRDQVRRLEEEWQPFRRGLRREFQELYDRLWRRQSQHSMAAGNMAPPDPERTVWMSMFLAQQRELEELRERLDALDGGEV